MNTEAGDDYLSWAICNILFDVRDDEVGILEAVRMCREVFRRETMAMQAYLVRD
jgi:hypothetical protein